MKVENDCVAYGDDLVGAEDYFGPRADVVIRPYKFCKNDTEQGERCERCRWQRKRAERVAAVDRC